MQATHSCTGSRHVFRLGQSTRCQRPRTIQLSQCACRHYVAGGALCRTSQQSRSHVRAQASSTPDSGSSSSSKGGSKLPGGSSDPEEGKALEDIASLLDDNTTRELEILSVDNRRAGSSSAQVLAEYSGRTDRVVGCLLGAMAGDALGVQVEPEPHYRLTRLFPEGIQDFWSFDVNTTKVQVAPGCVSGDFLLMTAVARSLADQGQLDLQHMLDCMHATYFMYPNQDRRYTPYGCMTVEAVCQGVDLGALAQRAEELLDLTPARNARSSSNREDQQRVGAGDATAVLRVTPIALAYAGTSQEVLQEAVDTAVMFSHPLPSGRDGALIHAAAVAWLCSVDPASGGATPAALLQHLQQLPISTSSRRLLDILAAAAAEQQVPLEPVVSWRQFWRSPQWHAAVRTYETLTLHNFALEGTQAAAVALWALVLSWGRPQQAVMMAAAFGGNASTTTALTGALAGALHGASWVPERWWAALENVSLEQLKQQELAAAAQLAVQRAGPGKQLDVKAVLKELQQQAEQAAKQQQAVTRAEGDEQQAAGQSKDDVQQLLMGRDQLVALAEQLAAIKCTTVAGVEVSV